MTKVRVTFSLDAETVKKLEALAKKKNRSKSNLVEVLINKEAKSE